MSTEGIRIRELRLAGVAETERSYGVSFKDPSGEWLPLSVIAGPSQTGKTSIADFIRYCLGGKDHPNHPEIVGAVRSALLEFELDGQVVTVERSATGSASTFAALWPGPLEEVSYLPEQRISTEPSGDPQGLSQFLLSGLGLDGVALPEAPTQDASKTQLLSIRDLFRVIFLTNDRLDSKNLAYEAASHMVRQKFQQLVEVLLGVHDPEAATLAAGIQRATEAVNEAKRAEEALRRLAEEDYPAGPLALEASLAEARGEMEAAEREIDVLDASRREADGHLRSMRERLENAQRTATRANVQLRDRRSLLSRLSALRAQYADDKRKLVFLTEAGRLFDPLSVTTCPACFSTLPEPPAVSHGRCGLCRCAVAEEVAERDSSDVGQPTDSQILASELRAVTRRLNDLNEYWDRLEKDTTRLKSIREIAEKEVDSAAASINRLVEVPAPWVAVRDAYSKQRADARLTQQSAQNGLRIWQRVRDAEERRERLEGTLVRLRGERRALTGGVDRGKMIRALSDRFEKILKDFDYPKLSQASIGDNLIPHVRGMNYSNASSGGLVLISLAYHLAIWEIAYESSPNAPGLLIIDSPQKNLGYSADPQDPDFADSRLVENFYAHVKDWLANDGQGAQLIVIDNSPPESVNDAVVIRYTRDPETPPYGLIPEAVE